MNIYVPVNYINLINNVNIIKHSTAKRHLLLIPDEMFSVANQLLEVINNQEKLVSILKTPFSLDRIWKVKKLYKNVSIIKETIGLEKVKLFINNETNITTQLLLSELENNRDKIFLLEDGFGLYQEQIYTIKSKIKNLIKEMVFRRKLYLGTYGYSGLFDYLLLKNPDLYTRSKGNINSERLIKMPNMWDKEIVEKLISLTELKGIEFPINKRRMIFFGQPLSEEGLLSRHKETLIVSDILNFFKTKNYEIYYKPHPRESLDKVKNFNTKLINSKWFPGEILPEIIRPNIVASVFSSTVINISNMYPEIQCFSIDIGNHAFNTGVYQDLEAESKNLHIIKGIEMLKSDLLDFKVDNRFSKNNVSYESLCLNHHF